MKKIYSILSGILLTASVWSQAPQKMSYQAVIRNNSNTLVTSTKVGMQISVLQGSASGTAVYVETQKPTTNANGLVSLEIGNGTAVSGTFAGIKWAEGPYFIKTETDPTGGTNYTILGTSELLSVPYALFSANSTPGPKGDKGEAGVQGLKGDQGNQGVQGEIGLTGSKGDKGIAGDQGIKGDQGNQGIQGEIGLTGSKGDKGEAGVQGLKGDQGNQGIQGEIGLTGSKGDKGIAGDQGIKGDQGIQGIQGEIGLTGSKGDKGVAGDQGIKGDQGIQGIQGEIGLTGPKGDKGVTGDQGIKGDKGEVGLTGSKGDKGETGTFQTGTVPGQMNYWNGSAWVIVSPGDRNQTLTFCDGVPTWGPCYPTGTIHCTNTSTSVVPVTNPTTGKIWMDRNLGATQVATSSSDAASYGDLYQWGRGADGHQCRTSAISSTLSTTDVPGNANFITSSSSFNRDWRFTLNDNLWQGVNGVNNPCPSGYRIPTDIELEAERLSWSANSSVGAFASLLKFPLAGGRSINGALFSFSVNGFYRSSALDAIYSRFLYIGNDAASLNDNHRAYGYSVRCIKD